MLVRPSVGLLVCPHITLSAFFSAVCEWINLKFGRDLHVHLLFQFLFFFSTSPLTPPSPPSSPQKLNLVIFWGLIQKLDAFLSF